MQHRPTQPNGPTKKESASDTAAQRRQLLADIRATYTTEHGKRVFEFLQSSAGCSPGKQRPAFERCVTAPATDGFSQSLAAAFTDGRKSHCYEIETLLSIPEDEPEQSPQAKR